MPFYFLFQIMAYRDFSLEKLEHKFGVRNQERRLFGEVQPVHPSPDLVKALRKAEELPIRSEKAKSEAIVFPLLLELRDLTQKFFTFYSGDILNADAAKGLYGECDFLLCVDIGSFSLSYPIVVIVEAKKNDIELGVPQCAAQMLGALIYNQKKGMDMERIYVCVTTGDEWVFLKLENNLVTVDSRKFYLNQIEQVLGVFQVILAEQKQFFEQLQDRELMPA